MSCVILKPGYRQDFLYSIGLKRGAGLIYQKSFPSKTDLVLTKCRVHRACHRCLFEVCCLKCAV